MSKIHRTTLCCIAILLFISACIPVLGSSKDNQSRFHNLIAEDVTGIEQNHAEIFTDLSGTVGAGILFDNRGSMFVGVRGALIKITPDGKKTTFCNLDKLPGKDYYFPSPLIWGMILDKENNIIAAAQDRILKISPEGQVKTLIREDFLGFLGASGIELDQKGNMYVTNGNKVVKYTPDLKKSIFIDARKAGDYYSLFSVKFDLNFNNLFVCDFFSSTIIKYPITPNGKAGKPSVVIAEPIKNASPYGAPLNIIFGDQGNSYVSIDGMSQLLKMDGTGKIEYLKLGELIPNHIIAFGGKGFDEKSIYFTTFNGLYVYKYYVGEKQARLLISPSTDDTRH